MKEKIYIIFKNNEEEYDDYSDWIIEIYKDKEKAEKRFVELVKTNQYKKDRAIRKAKYNEDIGAYRIEEHEIENETKRNEVIDTNSDSIEENIKYIEEVIALAKKLPVGELNIQEKEIETMTNILSDYKRVLKENEELKALDLSNSKMIANMSTRHFHDRGKIRNSIPKQKIKDVIKELEDNIYRIKKQYSNDGENCNTEYLENLAQVKILKQILKESEEK